VKGLRGYEIYMYGFAGVGIFYFNPKTEIDGHVYELQPMGTEGQGSVPTREKYSRIQMCIPVGIGFKYTIDRAWGVGLELGLRKTFTDYIDDVSTTYFDFAGYGDPEAALKEYVSDPSLGDPAAGASPTGAGMQRGDPRDKDSYLFAIFSINYKLKKGRHALPRF